MAPIKKNKIGCLFLIVVMAVLGGIVFFGNGFNKITVSPSVLV
jgi:hypothetical protein